MNLQKTIDANDKIYIQDLALRCIIGANDWERVTKQDVVINVCLYLDLTKPGITDQIEYTVDYKAIKNQIINLVETSEYFLIEHLAEKIASICLENKIIQAVNVRVDKPGALRFAKSVAIEILRDRTVETTAFISVGSNINPKENILKALTHLKRSAIISAISGCYWSKPQNMPNKNDFINGVWKIKTTLSPRYLKFSILRDIELKLGRVRTENKYEDRTIDLDLILYGDEIVTESDLEIPDSNIFDKTFIAVPLLEIEPDLILPGTGTRLFDLYKTTNFQGIHLDQAFTQELQQCAQKNEGLQNE